MTQHGRAPDRAGGGKHQHGLMGRAGKGTMRISLLWLAVGCVLLVAAAAPQWSAVGRAQAVATPTATACGQGVGCGTIQHIVFLVKENRSFDSMFGRYPGARGTTTFIGLDGKRHPLAHEPGTLANDIQHNVAAARLGMNGGRMNGFARIQGAIQHGVDEADSQFYGSDIPSYWAYAHHFTLADNFFSSVVGNSFSNHLFTVAATGNNISTNPNSPYWGCDAAVTTVVKQISVDGTIRHLYPCFNYQTETDLLDAKALSWRYYAPDQSQGGYIWSTLDAFRQVRLGPEWKTNVVNYTTFAADAAAGRLPAVSWLVQPATIADHPPHPICWGQNWTVAQINAIMSNQEEWAHTAIVVVWDDFGGFYDHVRPPSGPNPLIQYGPRVPALIISPYARAGYVDHHFYTFSSLLKLSQHVLGLPRLAGMDPRPESLLHAFDFTQRPLAPLILKQQTCSQPPPP